MPTSKPSPVFEVIFQGPGIYPENIPLAKVATALSAIKRLATGEVLAEEEDEEDEEGIEAPVGLLDVARGSARFRFTGKHPETAIAHLKDTGRALLNPGKNGHSEFILRPVKDLSLIAKTLRCEIIIKEPGRGVQPLATVQANSYELISKSLLLDGETSIAGKVVRVGGATALRCGLRVSFQKRLLYCKVENAEVGRRLGELLYQQVVVTGKARWLKSSMTIFAFLIRGVSQPETGSILQALDEIWEAGLKDWEKVDDPQSYLEEIRGEA